MSTINQFDWVDFYKEFAGILRAYKSKRPELIEKVRQIYEILSVDVIPAGMRLQSCQLLSWWRTPIQRRIKDKEGWRRTAYLFAFFSIV